MAVSAGVVATSLERRTICLGKDGWIAMQRVRLQAHRGAGREEHAVAHDTISWHDAVE